MRRSIFYIRLTILIDVIWFRELRMLNENIGKSADISGNIINRKTGTLRLWFIQLLKFIGPAFIVSVAYIDPGNFATNISGGSVFSYSLLWVILLSNLMAIFLQINSAKLGIATGKNLSEMCGIVFKRRTNWLLWAVSSIAAIATTIAEFLGGTLGLYILFGIPMPVAGIITGIITFVIAYLQKYGQKLVEIIITLLVAVICAAYATELFLADPDWIQVGLHTIMPSLQNGEALLIAVGMLGATVMPHVVFLHSQLVQHRNGGTTEKKKRHHLRMEKTDVVIAMNIAFIVKAAMLIVSAAVFYKQGIIVDSIEQAHKSLQPLLGSLSGTAFGIALLASGLSSSAVGAMAGETVLDGFVKLKIPVNVRRLITMIPALVIVLLGVNPMKALVLSQVSLSFALPFAIIPMLLITCRKDLMGGFANKTATIIMGWVISSAIIGLNALLVYTTLTSVI
jgi:manganese transport protein